MIEIKTNGVRLVRLMVDGVDMYNNVSHIRFDYTVGSIPEVTITLISKDGVEMTAEPNRGFIKRIFKRKA